MTLTRSERADGLTMMVPDHAPSAVMEALITGTLATNDAGCFTLQGGEVAYPLQFPYGTQLSDDGLTVHVPNLKPLQIGDAIRGGGGYVHLDAPPELCAAENEYDEYAVWQTVEQ